MIWHSTDTENVLSEFDVSKDIGLINSIAETRLEKVGKNTITNIEKPSIKKHFLLQLKDKYVFILAVIAVFTSIVSLIYKSDYLSPFLIIAIVVLNAFISAYQMYKSEIALNKIRSVASPVATVIREGIEKQIPSEDLVPGDIIIIKAGENIPADARLIETTNFSCNEYILSGSDIPVNKKAEVILDEITDAKDRTNMVFSGCLATLGTAKAVVVETGLNTEIGRSSTIDQQTGEYSLPIQERLDSTGKLINIFIFIVCAVIFAIQVILKFGEVGFAAMTTTALLNSMALAVAAIPEGLPAISTIAVALGIERIIKDEIIIKKVSALEALGKTTVICSSKTGIITKNRMFVDRVFDGETSVNISDGELSEKHKTILRVAAGCSMLQNDSTESSIKQACIDYTGISHEELDNLFPRIGEIPFDSVRKIMTSINMIDGKPVAIVKGAPESMADKLSNIDSKIILEENDKMAADALRVVCVAIKPLNEVPINPTADEIENDLTFIGLIGIDDPPRTATIDAINVSDKAGIKTLMITGDNLTTAKAVARRVGILKDGTDAITGAELSKLSDEELKENINKYTVFARISPEDKLRIISALQANGEIVTVTGDDFDDVPALVNADIGCAIGKLGTDVARGHADIIIKNSYFDSIINAIKESRGLFANIQKSVAFLLSCNIAEVFLYLVSLLIFKRPIISAVELLWINLLTDCAPVLALATTSAEERVMDRCPASLKGRLFDVSGIIDIALQSLFIMITTIFAFYIGKSSVSFDTELSVKTGMTMAFTVLALTELFHAFNIRTTESIFLSKYKIKDFFILSSALILFIVLFLVLTPAGNVFGLCVLKPTLALISFALALTILPFCEILKIIKKRIK